MVNDIQLMLSGCLESYAEKDCEADSRECNEL